MPRSESLAENDRSSILIVSWTSGVVACEDKQISLGRLGVYLRV